MTEITLTNLRATLPDVKGRVQFRRESFLVRDGKRAAFCIVPHDDNKPAQPEPAAAEQR